MLFCHVTTHLDGDKYANLLREKGGTGFPFLVFMDADGNVLARQGDRTVAAFERTRARLADVMALQAKVAGGDKTAAPALLLAQIDLGTVKYADAKARIEAFGKLDGELGKKLQARLLDLEVQDVLEGTRTPAAVQERDARFLAMFAEGRVPTGDVARTFYGIVMSAAEGKKDAATFAKALQQLQHLLGNDPRYAKTLENMQKRLEKLQAGGKG